MFNTTNDHFSPKIKPYIQQRAYIYMKMKAFDQHKILSKLSAAIHCMRGSRNFRQGRVGPGQSDKKALTTLFFFLVISLFYKSQMVNFKENYHFPRFKRGFNIFQGGGVSNFFQGGGPTFSRGGGGSNCLFPIETHITCDFPGGPCPPPPPHLDPHLHCDSYWSKSSSNVLQRV